MNKREVIRLVLDGKQPPYVPWSFGFTFEAREKLQAHYGQTDLEPYLKNHIVNLGSDIGFFKDIGNDCVQDVFGVVWDRSVDKDIGIVRNQVLSRARLSRTTRFPIRSTRASFRDTLGRSPPLFPPLPRLLPRLLPLRARVHSTRGMENLMLDFIEHPWFAEPEVCSARSPTTTLRRSARR